MTAAEFYKEEDEYITQDDTATLMETKTWAQIFWL